MRPTCQQTGECDGHDCWAHVQWWCAHAGLVRVFSSGDLFGDPYCYAIPFVVTVQWPAPDKHGRLGLVEFEGVRLVMRPCQYRAIREAMRAEHYGVLSTRSKQGRMRTTEVCKPRGVQDSRVTAQTAADKASVKSIGL